MLSYLHGVAARLIPQTSVHGPGHTFHSFVTVAKDDLDSQGPLMLPDLLLQVLCHLDSRTLCTTVPLVCKAWREAAEWRQIWAARIDPAVLALLQLQPSSASARATDSRSYVLSPAPGEGNGTPKSSHCAPGNQPSAAAAAAALAVRLPLLHHALYSRNLLRNPLFQALCNSDRKAKPRPASSGTFQGLPTGVFTSQQRRLAWATTVGDHGPQGLAWECPPSGLPAGIAPPQLPLPALATSSSSSSAAAGLQGWLRGLKEAATAPSAAAAAAAAAGAAGCLAADVPAAMAAGATAAISSAAVSCLATGSSWGEVVQVVDLLEELTHRGISPDLAAALLDSGSLALGLSVWVAAPAAAATDTAGEATAATAAAAAGSEAAWSGFTAATAVNAAAGQRQQQQQAAPREPPGSHQPQFAAALMLDDGQVPLRSFQTFVRRPSSHHFFSSRLPVLPGRWHRYAYLLPACPPGCRRAVVLLRGRGPQMLAPHQPPPQSGVKFACAQLAFIQQSEVAAFGAEECLAGWASGRPL